MLPVNADTMWAIVLRFKGTIGIEQQRIIAGVGAALQTRLTEYDVTTPLRIAHFLAQCAQESAGYRTLVEFSSGTQYQWRKDLGNTHPGDGAKYRGRALIEITGRANYVRIGKALGIDLENHPELLEESPEVALQASLEFWKEHNLNDYADEDDIVGETEVINGGTNGLASRRDYLKKCKAVLVKLAASGLPSTRAHPVLYRGMDNSDVGMLQGYLRLFGYKIAVDNDFGGATELAVAKLQEAGNLDDDGIVGPDTWAYIDKRLASPDLTR